MKLFIDSANLKEIETALTWGIVDGVTTNPSLATKAGVKFKVAAKQILAMVSGPVSLEVVATEVEPMMIEARKLAQLGENVVVKLPTTTAGLTALKQLKAEGLKINMTLVFSSVQALLVGKLKADYVSPFVGRLDDMATQAGQTMAEEIVQIYDNYGFETEILYASVRNLDHVKHAALIGADVATVPFNILEQLVKHKMTDMGLKQFLDDWQAAGQEALV